MSTFETLITLLHDQKAACEVAIRTRQGLEARQVITPIMNRVVMAATYWRDLARWKLHHAKDDISAYEAEMSGAYAQAACEACEVEFGEQLPEPTRPEDFVPLGGVKSPAEVELPKITDPFALQILAAKAEDSGSPGERNDFELDDAVGEAYGLAWLVGKVYDLSAMEWPTNPGELELLREWGKQRGLILPAGTKPGEVDPVDRATARSSHARRNLVRSGMDPEVFKASHREATHALKEEASFCLDEAQEGLDAAYEARDRHRRETGQSPR